MRQSIAERINGNTIQIHKNSISVYNSDGVKAGVITGIKQFSDFQPRERFALNDELRARGANLSQLQPLKFINIQGENYCLQSIWHVDDDIIKLAEEIFGDHYLKPKHLMYSEYMQ